MNKINTASPGCTCSRSLTKKKWDLKNQELSVKPKANPIPDIVFFKLVSVDTMDECLLRKYLDI